MATAAHIRAGRPPTLRTLLAYRAIDQSSEVVIGIMIVFSPWAFGTTLAWSIWFMNGAGYVLGILLALKLMLRRWRGCQPARWPDSPPNQAPGSSRRGPAVLKLLTAGLLALTGLILAYCLVAALNARAAYEPWRMDFAYRKCVSWLPHSYDRSRTWQMFFNLLALAAFFWAVRDWLLGKSAADERTERDPNRNPGRHAILPERLRRLLWLLSLNGAVLGVESIAQRMSGTNQLLWVMPTRLNRDAESQFGPYAYRANAAQYFNLAWPAALGLWWGLRRDRRRVRAHTSPESRQREAGPAPAAGQRQHLLLPCVLVMLACPIMSASRGGAIVAAVMTAAAAALLWFGLRRRHPSVRFAVLLFLTAGLGLGAYLGGDQLAERMRDFDTGLTGREHIYQTARRIAHDYPLFGIGPGAFERVFQIYRTSADEFWPAELHNDWLETRITFGWLGSGLIATALILVLAHWFVPGNGIPGSSRFTALLWLALAGCLLHARFDFPFQIYSLQLLFLLHCAILSCLSRRGPAP